MTSFKQSVPVFALAAALSAAPAFSGDAGTKERIEERLAKAGIGSAGDIQVQVRDGAVVLEGTVASLEASRKAERAAAKEAKAVENRLQVVVAERPDSELRKDVEKAILRYPYYTVFDSVGAGVDAGVVTLVGSVSQPYRKSDLEARVAAVPGIRAVDDRILVQRVSLFDDDLRRELARKIYRSDSFAQYAGWPNPPIRIIVDGGRVTLTGYVRSPVERALLGHIARGTLAFAVDNQVQVAGEPPAEDRKADAPQAE